MIQSISGLSGGMQGMGGMRGMRGMQGRPDTQQVFSKMDTDGDGSLNTSELQAMSDKMAEKMGGNAPSMDDLMAKFDGDGDGALSFAEFDAARPQGPPGGGALSGMMPTRGGYGGGNQMDLSSLFNESEDDSETQEDNIYAYA